MRAANKWIFASGFLVTIAACGSEDDPGADGTGGYTGFGGNTPTGGVVGSGGAGGAQIGSGGITTTGGVMGTGGFAPNSGGVIGAGGGPGAGGDNTAGGGGTGEGGGGTGNGGGGTGNGGAGVGGAVGGAGGGSTTIPPHGDPPSSLSSARGPYQTTTYTISAGCIHYPTNAPGPFAAVVISDGFGGSGGCNSIQTGQWGPLYASWGIVTMIINTNANDQPQVRGRKLTAAIEAFKAENTKSGGQLNGKLAGRYGSSGFSMGGGGTTYTAAADSTLLTNIPIMPWRPVSGAQIRVPSLYICGQSDNIASCNTHGTPSYNALPDSTPQMRITVPAGHSGQPSAGSGRSGAAGLAFQKVFLEGDERWRPLLKSVQSNDTNIQ